MRPRCTAENDLWNLNYPSLYIPAHPGRFTVDAPSVPSGEVRHANLRFTNGDHEANFPITVVKDDTADKGLPLTKSCELTILWCGETTECTITASNVGTSEPVAVSIRDRPPREVRLEGGVNGADRLGRRRLVFEGELPGAAPPGVEVIVAQRGVGPLLGFLPSAQPTYLLRW